MKIFAFLFILLFTNLGFCQNPFYVSIDKTSGLPSNSVYDILQDSKGFMWFATGKGICRYDGSTFKTFSSDEQTSKSGSCLVEDGFGRIWYSNFDGYLYYVEKNVLKSLKQPTSLGYFRFGIIKDELFLLQPNMVLVYDLRTLKVKSKIKISDKQISFSYASPEKFYILGASLYEFNDSKTYTKHPLPNKFYDEINGSIMNYWDHKLIINSKSNNIYYSFKDGEFTRNALNTTTNFNQNTSIVNNTIWICTTNGIIKNDLDSKETISYFADQNISYLFRDNHKNYWISTLNKGILFIEDFENNYIDIQPRPLTLSLGKNEIYIGAEKDLVYKLNFKKLVTEKILKRKTIMLQVKFLLTP